MMDTTRLTAEEKAMLARLEQRERPDSETTVSLWQVFTDTRTTLATIAALREKLAACEEAKSALNIMNQGLITENNKLIAKLAAVEKERQVSNGKQLIDTWFKSTEMFRKDNIIGIGEDEWGRLEQAIDNKLSALEEKLAACEEAKSALNIMNQGLITENNKLIATLARNIIGIGEDEWGRLEQAIDNKLSALEEKLAAMELAHSKALCERDKEKEVSYALGRERDDLRKKLAACERALNDIIIRAKRIREDKAVVGIDASFIEQKAKQALKETQGGAR